jgi:hypothetical protein
VNFKHVHRPLPAETHSLHTLPLVHKLGSGTRDPSPGGKFQIVAIVIVFGIVVVIMFIIVYILIIVLVIMISLY